MNYDYLLAGSPVIPVRFIVYNFSGIILIILVSYLLYKKNFRPVLFKSFLIYQLFTLAIFFSLALYFLTQVPEITVKTIKSANNNGDAVEIIFNRPVKRGDLEKSIEPYSAGLWIYEDPMYDTHLYRKLVFYPYNRLSPGQEYQIKLRYVKNFLNQNSADYAYNFRTPGTFDVLGDSTTGYKFSVTGSFPQNGWDGINIDTLIRLRFSHAVNKASAESHFSISPFVSGNFSWEGETMIFMPLVNLEYETAYTISEAQGVKIQNGNFLTQKYTASFTTQPEITKLSAPSYLQKYTLSCEIAALRMALAYRGVEVGEDELIEKTGYDPNRKNGSVWGNPYVGFVGNIRGKQMVSGYGVYWEPIARVANNYRYAKSFENWDTKNITQSIQKGTPVIVWISINGKNPTLWNTPGGDKIKAVADEHAVLVTGYTGSPENPSKIIVNDPLIGEAFWRRDAFENKWAALGRSGVLVF